MGATLRRASTGIAIALVSGLTACVIVSDDDGSPLLGIELFWDEDPADDDFVGGSCYGADVETMSWTLSADDGFEVAGREDQGCRDRIEVSEISPGDHTLEITGFDADGIARWRTRCTGLVIVRFNELYGCEIRSIDGAGNGDGSNDGSNDPTQPDGGVADGG